MIINLHAGHNPDGRAACGAVGLISESTQARKVKDTIASLLRGQGHTVFDCTCDNGIGQSDILKRITEACNSNPVDLDVSIHFNAGANATANGKTTGTEVFIYSDKSAAKPYAQAVCNSIAALGYTNRGVKIGSGLYFLKNTKAPAMLIECCFVDDPDDVSIYDADKMALAIVAGITVGKDQREAGEVRDQARLAAMTKEEFVDWIGNLAQEDMQTSSILASVTTAQAILESAYGKSELALNALNLGGMKANLSGNNWGSSWDGQVYEKMTGEQLADGSYISIKAEFRKYSNIASYLKDHSDYLLGAKSGSGLRYAGLAGCRDYKQAFQIIKNGGYATSHDYVKNLCAVVENWNLTRFNAESDPIPEGIEVVVSAGAYRKDRGKAEALRKKVLGMGVQVELREYKI